MNSKRFSLVVAAPLLLLFACSSDSASAESDSGAETDSGETTTDGGTSVTDSGVTDSGTSGSDSGAANAGEPAELAGTLSAHNAARAAENAGLPPLTWDPALATIAKNWASQCKSASGSLIDHNGGRSDGYPSYVGENIYASSGSATGPQAVSSWMSEKKNYDLAKNSCSGVCGHYTQVVWKKTTKLGCALVNCPNLRYPSTIVCDYGPGGNDGGAPY